MRNSLLAFLLFFAIPACAGVNYPAKELDEIKVLLEEKLDGTKTGNFMFLNLYLFKNDGKVEWSTGRVQFTKYHKEDPFGISMETSASAYSFSSPHLDKVEWKPGNELKANYDMVHNCGKPMTLLAKRVSSKEKDAWEVRITGIYCDIDIEASKKHKWEFITVNNIKLMKSVLTTWDRYKK